MNKFSWKSLRDIPHEFIITIGDGVRSSDLMLFFDFDIGWWVNLDPKKDTCLIHYQHFDSIRLPELAVALDQMPSNSQAIKNGWNKEIPEGYSEFKRKFHKFYILKITKDF